MFDAPPSSWRDELLSLFERQHRALCPWAIGPLVVRALKFVLN